MGALEQNHTVQRKGGADTPDASSRVTFLPCLCDFLSFLLHPQRILRLSSLPVGSFIPDYSAFYLWILHDKAAFLPQKMRPPWNGFWLPFLSPRGAYLAFQVGLPLELIKILGEWKSNAVPLYLTVLLDLRVKATTLLAHNIPQQ